MPKSSRLIVAVRVGAAEFLLLHRVRHALERMDGERHGLGHAVQREFALHFRGRAVLELGELALVGRGREFLDVEEIGAIFRCVVEISARR